MKQDSRPRIQFDDQNWFVISTGTEREGFTFCHLAACYQFQKDGKTPVQINDWVPNSVLSRATGPTMGHHFATVGGDIKIYADTREQAADIARKHNYATARRF